MSSNLVFGDLAIEITQDSDLEKCPRTPFYTLSLLISMPILSLSVLGLPLLLPLLLSHSAIVTICELITPRRFATPLNYKILRFIFGPYLPPPPPTPVRLTVDHAEPIFLLGWITSFQLEIVPTILLQLISFSLMIGPTHFDHLVQRAKPNVALFTLPLLLSFTMASYA